MHSREELVAQARRRYPAFLRSIVEGANFFPLEIRSGKTLRAHDYAGRLAQLKGFRATSAELGLHVEWREVNDPRFGRHERPEAVSFIEEVAFLKAVQKSVEVGNFRNDLHTIRATCPALESWLVPNIAEIVRHHGSWPQLLRVVRWIGEHPRCGLYPRQLPIPGVDSKFIEQRHGILDSLLVAVNPESIMSEAPTFEGRHGLRSTEPLIRMRFLDPEFQSECGFSVNDLAIPLSDFRLLSFPTAAVVIVENLRNFLALPTLPRTIGVYGEGNAVGLLAGAQWLVRSRLAYWGDIDAHGFVILGRLRRSYPHVESVLMDFETLTRWRFLAIANHPEIAAASHLTPDECVAETAVRAQSLRLEQERLPYYAVCEALQTWAAKAPRSL